MQTVLDVVSPEPATPVDVPTWESLHPKARIGMRIGAIVGFALLYVIPASIGLAVWDSAGLSPLAKLVLYSLGFVLVVWLGWRYANASYARTAFALTSVGLRIQRGILWRSETLVPRSRVQHIDLNRGPLDRRFGLATLKLYTAGTKLASVALDGLPDARATELRDALVSQEDDAV